MIMNWLSTFVAGLWPMVWHFGTAGGIAIIAAIVAWLVPAGGPLGWIKQVAFAVAVGAALFMAGMAVGVKDANSRWEAKWSAAIRDGAQDSKRARDRAVRNVARGVRDKRDIDPPQ